MNSVTNRSCPYNFYIHSTHKSKRKNVSKRGWSRQSLYFRPIIYRYLYHTKIAFRTDRSFVWHQAVGLESCSNRLISIALPRSNCLISKFNSLFFLKIFHWPFDLGWLFKIRTDSGFFQNLIWGLRYYLYTDWSGKSVLGPRGSKVHWVNLSRNYFDNYRYIKKFILMCYLTSDFSRQ